MWDAVTASLKCRAQLGYIQVSTRATWAHEADQADKAFGIVINLSLKRPCVFVARFDCMKCAVATIVLGEIATMKAGPV